MIDVQSSWWTDSGPSSWEPVDMSPYVAEGTLWLGLIYTWGRRLSALLAGVGADVITGVLREGRRGVRVREGKVATKAEDRSS